jgi:hypothetical protein
MEAASLWDRVGRTLRLPPTSAEQDFCVSHGLLHNIESITDPHEMDNQVAEVVRTIENLRVYARSVRDSRPVGEPIGSFNDPRWQLWRDLIDKASGGQQRSRWRPFYLQRHVDRTIPGVLSQTIRVEFDHRMPMAALLEELKGLWPKLVEREWVRPSKPLGDRKIALIRLVCLELGMDMTWEQRLQEWNLRYPDWQYSGNNAVRKFAADFHDGEARLAGFRGALRWAYDGSEWEFQHLMADGTGAEFWARTDPKSRSMQQRILAAQLEEENTLKGGPADEHQLGRRQPSEDSRLGGSIVSFDFRHAPERPGAQEK